MKLDRMPDSATIMAFREVIDFYYWKGMPVARSWPKRRGVPLTPNERISVEDFTVTAKISGAVDPAVREAWKNFVKGVGVTWIDGIRAATRGRPWITLR